MALLRRLIRELGTNGGMISVESKKLRNKEIWLTLRQRKPSKHLKITVIEYRKGPGLYVYLLQKKMKRKISWHETEQGICLKKN